MVSTCMLVGSVGTSVPSTDRTRKHAGSRPAPRSISQRTWRGSSGAVVSTCMQGRSPAVSSRPAARRSGGGAQHGARLGEARARGVDDLIDAEVESNGRLGVLALGDAIGAQQLGGVVLAVRDEDFVSRSNRACGPDL